MGYMKINLATWCFAFLILATLVAACSDNGTDPNSPPTVPVIDTASGAPADSATGVELPVILYWQSSDPDGDSLFYDVYFGQNPDPIRVAINEPFPEYAPVLLGYELTYYWRVVARDPEGEEVSSPVWMFTTQKNPDE